MTYIIQFLQIYFYIFEQKSVILLNKNLGNCKECIKKKEKIQQIGVKSTKKRKNVLKFYKIGKVFVQIHNKNSWEKCRTVQTLCNDWTEKKIYVIIAKSGKRNNKYHN